MSMSREFTTSLTVDNANRIVDLGDSWLLTAEEGGGANLTVLQPNRLLNCFLSDSIKDDNTIMLMESLLSVCRLRGETLYREYRCDSPTHKRFMEIELIPFEDGHVQMNHYLLREEAFDKPVKFDFAYRPTEAIPKTYFRCSMCNKLSLTNSEHSDEWEEPEVFTQQHSLEKSMIIHTVCKACRSTVMSRKSFA